MNEERDMFIPILGIEPKSMVLETIILPLNYTGVGSNKKKVNL
jgi:hypothetical protein